MKPRHELKFYINFSDHLQIASRLQNLAKLDKYANDEGFYKIRSLYFDNYNDKALQEKLLGINHREKFRIRLYNDDTSFIRLEKKSKHNNLCTKTSCPITKEECERLLNGELDFLKTSPEPLFNELYQKINTQGLKPKTLVDYNRQAYIYHAGNVRITLDSEIRTGLYSLDLFEPELPTLISDNSSRILEVKYDEFLPNIIRDSIQVGGRARSAISKYALCRCFG